MLCLLATNLVKPMHFILASKYVIPYPEKPGQAVRDRRLNPHYKALMNLFVFKFINFQYIAIIISLIGGCASEAFLLKVLWLSPAQL